MKKFLFILPLLFILNISQAQIIFPYGSDDATITLKDGSELHGSIKIKHKGIMKGEHQVIKFRKNKIDEEVIYDYSSIKKIQYKNIYEKTVTAEFVFIDKYNQPQLLDIEIEGNMSLYSKKNPNSNGPGIGQGMAADAMGKIFYLKRMKENRAEFYIIYGSIPSKSFKKVIRDYFQDCSAIQVMVKNKEFKKNDFREIVNYYNEVCAPQLAK